MELTATGLVLDTLDEIIDEFNQAELAGIATTLNLNAPDPIAVMNGVFGERLQALEEIVGAMYSGMIPDNADGDMLTGLCLITGTTRDPADATVVDCSITVDAAFTAAAGTMFASVDGVPNVLYTNVDEFTAGGAGTTTGVTFQCTQTGANAVNAGTLTVISSPLTHWTAITNPATGVTGRAIQTDASLRLAQRQELALGGSTSAAAIAADVLAYIQPGQSPLTVPGIKTGTGYNPYTIAAATLSVKVLWNDSGFTDDVTGLPAYSFEVIAYNGGAADSSGTKALCALILCDKAAGMRTYSGLGTYQTIIDDQGISVDVYYTRPATLTTNITITVKQRAGYVVTETQVKDAITTYTQGTLFNGTAVENATAHWTPGGVAYASSVIGAAFNLEGVENVPVVALSGGTPDVTPTLRQIVKVGTITVTLT